MEASKKYKQPAEEQIFWDRLAEMPWIEAEELCARRKEQLSLELAMLQQQKAAASKQKEADRIGVEMSSINKTISVLNEKIKWYRKRLDAVNWRRAVEAIWGSEGYVACREWIVKSEATYDSKTN